MVIINKAKVNGLHQLKSWHLSEVPEGWAIVPPNLEREAAETCGYCEIEIDADGAYLTILTATERPPEPEPEPTVEENLVSLTNGLEAVNAKLDYIGMMTEVL